MVEAKIKVTWPPASPYEIILQALNDVSQCWIRLSYIFINLFSEYKLPKQKDGEVDSDGFTVKSR